MTSMRHPARPASRPWALALTALFATLPLFAQAPSTQTASAPTTTIHASARLVVVDVVVTDGRGDPVRDLKQTDFHLIEDKSPQTIRSFEEHTKTSDLASPAPPPPKLQPGVFTDTPPAPVDSTVNILLLDTLNTPMQNQAFVRGQLLKFLQNAKSGTRIAIFGLNSKLVMLQGITANLALLRRAVEHSHPTASDVLSEKVGGKEDIVAAIGDTVAGTLGSDQADGRMHQALGEFEADPTNLENAAAAQATLDAFNQLARYLAGIPGHKNLMWFSESFPLEIQARTSLTSGQSALNPFAGNPAWEGKYRETVNLLAGGRIAVFPIDARGLQPSTMLKASYSGGQRGISTIEAADHSTMFDLAEATGGKALINSNGLAEAVEQITQSGSNYYTLAYTPTDAKPGDRYRAIHVQVDPGHYKLAYRRGYFGESKGPASVVIDPMKAALVPTAPPPTQIPFYARVLPLPADAEHVVAPGEKSRPRLDSDNGDTLRYRVDFSTDPRNLTLTSSADNVRHGHLEFTVVAFDAQGKQISANVKSVQASWNDAQYSAVQQQGVRYQQEISVPAIGEHRLRVIVHDLNSGQIGAIDIPLASLPK